MHIIETRKGHIESIDDSSDISPEIYDTINTIRKDCWSYFIDYANCKPCNTTYKKSDIFSEVDHNCGKKDISTLEKKHPNIWINCTNCESTLEHPRKDKDSEDLRDRLENTMWSSLVLYKTHDWNNIETQGFSLIYADTFENIYNREFEPYFNDNLRDLLKDYMEKTYLTVAATCINEAYSHLSIIFDLIKSVFYSLDTKFQNIPITAEFMVWSVTEKVYELMWGEKMWFINTNPEIYIWEPTSDILLHATAYKDYTSALNLPISTILKMRKLKKT
jgi:hypothetical protein